MYRDVHKVANNPVWRDPNTKDIPDLLKELETELQKLIKILADVKCTPSFAGSVIPKTGGGGGGEGGRRGGGGEDIIVGGGGGGRRGLVGGAAVNVTLLSILAVLIAVFVTVFVKK